MGSNILKSINSVNLKNLKVVATKDQAGPEWHDSLDREWSILVGSTETP